MSSLFLTRPVEGEVFQLEEEEGKRRLRFKASTNEWSYRYWGAVRMDVAGIDLKRIDLASGVPFTYDHEVSSRWSDRTPEDYHHGYVFNGELADDLLYLDVEFHDDPKSIDAYETIRKKKRRGCSIGLHNDFETAVEPTGRMIDDRPELGLVYTKSELVHFSSVLVPQQSDTGVVFDQGGDDQKFFLPLNQIRYEQEIFSRTELKPETEPEMVT